MRDLRFEVDTKSNIVSIPGIPDVNACVEALKSAGYEALPLLDDSKQAPLMAPVPAEKTYSLLLDIEGMTCQYVLQTSTLDSTLSKFLYPTRGTCFGHR